jgi:YD repeat-containing protein
MALAALASEASAQPRQYYDSSGKRMAARRPTAPARSRLTMTSGRVISRETTTGNQTTVYDAGGRNVGRFTTMK